METRCIRGNSDSISDRKGSAASQNLSEVAVVVTPANKRLALSAQPPLTACVVFNHDGERSGIKPAKV